MILIGDEVLGIHEHSNELPPLHCTQALEEVGPTWTASRNFETKKLFNP